MVIRWKLGQDKRKLKKKKKKAKVSLVQIFDVVLFEKWRF